MRGTGSFPFSEHLPLFNLYLGSPSPRRVRQVATVCVDPAVFDVNVGVLDITSIMPVTLVRDQPFTAGGNGGFPAERPLPGQIHHDVTMTPWVNPHTAPVLAIAEVMCLGSFIIAPQPNLVFIRARATVAVGTVADTPDISAEFDSEFGGGFDITDQNPDDDPEVGRLHRGTAAFVIRKTPVEVPPGQSVSVKFRMASYTPQPWLANANFNAANHEATVRNAYIRLWVGALGEVVA